MRIMVWNYRGLGSPSTVPQLKKSLRLLKPDLIFFSETKRKESFVSKICQKLGWEDWWMAMDPIGRSGGILVGWGSNITMFQVICSSYNMEVEFTSAETK